MVSCFDAASPTVYSLAARGGVAQLGERYNRTVEVGGSSPPASTRPVIIRPGARPGRFLSSSVCLAPFFSQLRLRNAGQHAPRLGDRGAKSLPLACAASLQSPRGMGVSAGCLTVARAQCLPQPPRKRLYVRAFRPTVSHFGPPNVSLQVGGYTAAAATGRRRRRLAPAPARRPGPGGRRAAPNRRNDRRRHAPRPAVRPLPCRPHAPPQPRAASRRPFRRSPASTAAPAPPLTPRPATAGAAQGVGRRGVPGDARPARHPAARTTGAPGPDASPAVPSRRRRSPPVSPNRNRSRSSAATVPGPDDAPDPFALFRHPVAQGDDVEIALGVARAAHRKQGHHRAVVRQAVERAGADDGHAMQQRRVDAVLARRVACRSDRARRARW